MNGKGTNEDTTHKPATDDDDDAATFLTTVPHNYNSTHLRSAIRMPDVLIIPHVLYTRRCEPITNLSTALVVFSVIHA